jgi:hypothetical protein
MMNAFNDRLATQKDILSQVQDSLGQLKSGNFPPGYSPAIMSTLQSRILSQTSAEARNARQAAGNYFAGRGGGASSALPSGVQAAVAGDIAGTIGAKEADLLSQLQIENFNVGRENLLKSIGGLTTLAGEEAPLQFGQQASAATSEAFGQAKTIQQQKNQKWADIAGGITGAAKAGLGVLSGGASGLIASPFSSSGGFLGTPTAGSLSPTDAEISGDLVAPQ